MVEKNNIPLDLKVAVSKLDSLPPMPVIAQKLLGLNLDTDQGEQLMLVLISQEPLISAKLIGLANSAMVGASKRVASVKDATLLLGLRRVKSVAFSLAMMSQMDQPVGRLDLHGLWMHNWGIAFAMLPISHAMPAKLRPSDDQVFLTGMLHDIGYLALAYLDVERSDELQVRMVIEAKRLTLDIEHEVVGITHNELGAELARHWNLPEEIVGAIRCHHAPDAGNGEPHMLLLAQIINLAEKLLPSFGSNEQIDHTIHAEEWAALGIDPDRAEEIAELVSEQSEQASQFVGTLFEG